MKFHIITIFPTIFESYFNESIIKRAKEKGKIEIKIHNLRDYTEDKHKTVDDTPYGGGPGMVLKVEPIFKCVEKIKKDEIKKGETVKIFLTSAKGEEFSQNSAEEMTTIDNIVIICGRYEGVDERIAQNVADKEISIGKYILTGGELPAMVIVDSVSRLLPGVLGNKESLVSESHSEEDLFDYPVYTKPDSFNNWDVPAVLLSGHHKEIESWRQDKKQK
jgi:tRNA (guanine37-N1)-methyltransferase